MAEEKITIVDLRKAIAKQTGTEEAQVGVFLSQLIAAIKEGLKRDKQVRISGLGTFKLLWVEPRKSVNISTGDAIIIEGYQKLSFTPEPSVKERINEPFSNLIPVELDENGNPLPDQPKPKADPMRKLDEQALEIKDLLADLNGEAAAETPATEAAAAEVPAEPEVLDVPEEPATEKTAAEEPAVAEAAAEEESELDKTIAAAAAVVAAVKDIPMEPIDEEEETAKRPEKPVSPEEPEVPEEPAAEPAAEPAEPAAETAKKEEKPKKPFRWWLVALITLFVLALFILLLVLFLENKVEKWADKLNGKTPTEQVIEEPAPYVPVADTLDLNDSIAPVLAEEAAPAEAPAAKTDFYKERNYTDFIGIETVKEGSRLTWIAKRYYGQKDLWVFIYEANKEKIKNPSNVVVGTQLRIPALPEEILDPDNQKTQKLVKELQDTYLK